ncbi:MAG TPA: hypothetical protein VHP37_04930 [Burkholderiales bacterium]|nr:hypothetical protein [Burkholderiales bacterium]
MSRDTDRVGIRQISTARFPYYALSDSLDVAKTVHFTLGGTTTLDELAAALGYAGTNNGAFKSRVAAARIFGLLEKSGNRFSITDLARSILMPVYEWSAKESLVEAFFNVELFQRVFEEYRGKQLPTEAGMKNALKTAFGITPGVVDRAYRVLMDSADTARFFDARGGARTHLIVPSSARGIGSTPVVPAEEMSRKDADVKVDEAIDATSSENTTPDGGGGLPHTAHRNQLSEMKARYIASLIKIFESKADKGELDEALMSRIENLLGHE